MMSLARKDSMASSELTLARSAIAQPNSGPQDRESKPQMDADERRFKKYRASGTERIPCWVPVLPHLCPSVSICGYSCSVSMLVQVFLDALRFAQKEGRVLVGRLDEFLKYLHRVAELFGKLRVLLV